MSDSRDPKKNHILVTGDGKEVTSLSTIICVTEPLTATEEEIAQYMKEKDLHWVESRCRFCGLALKGSDSRSYHRFAGNMVAVCIGCSRDHMVRVNLGYIE